MVLYDAFRNDPSLNPTGKLHPQLSAVACTKDFFNTSTNMNLLRGFSLEGLIFKGPEGLNSIDQALRNRNAALTRAIMSNANSDWSKSNDTRKLRSILNSILLEIETGNRS